jgi:HD-GYP domain-containing protein (c-di-GMP phosphodiesterase class II)
MSIRTRLLLALVPVILILFGLLTFFNFKLSEDTVIRQITSEVLQLARSYSQEFDIFAETSAKVADGLAIAVANLSGFNDEVIKGMIKNNLEQNPSLYGSTISLVPDATPLGYYAPYYFRSQGKLKFNFLSKATYNYPVWEWFIRPIKDRKGFWTEPYFDRGGGDVLMTTYAAPIIKNNRAIGVATVDISLDNLVQRVRHLKIGETGYAFILSRKGYYIAHPDKGLLSKESIWKHYANEDPDLQKLEDLVKNQQAGTVPMGDPFSDKMVWVIIYPIKSTNWTLVIIYPRVEILRPLIILRYAVIVISVLLILLLIFLILWVSSSATAPIARLVQQTERFAGGDFETRLNDSRGVKEIRKLSKAFNVMGDAIAQKIQELVETQREIVYRLGRAAEYRDTDTGAHLQRMSHYCAALARAYGLSSAECELILYASPMHDIGKIGIPDAILRKKGKLDEEEYNLIKTHTLIGTRILAGSNSRLLQMAQEIAVTHHEKWDGSGYPKGLKGKEIPLVGRIASICDVFDSLTTERPYKKAWSVEEALQEIEAKSGKDFDPHLVELFKKILPEILAIKAKFEG